MTRSPVAGDTNVVVPRAAPAVVPRGARVAVLVCCLAGVAALAAGGLLPLAAAAAAALVLPAAAAAPAVVAARARPGSGRLARGLLGALLLAVGTASALVPGTALGTRLSLLLLGVLLLQQVLADTVRELGTTLVVAAGAVLLAVGLAPGPAVAVPLAVAWAAGVVAAAGIRTAAASAMLPLVTPERADGSPPSVRLTLPSTPLRAALAVVGLTMVAALLGVLLIPRTDGLDAARSALSGAGLGQAGGAGGQRTAFAYSGQGALDMRSRGSLPTTPVAVVAPGSPRLWRTSVLDQYDGIAWYPARIGTPVAIAADGTVPDVLDAAAGSPAQPPAVASGEAVVEPSGPSREDDVRVLDGLRGALPVPGRAVRVRGPADAYVTDGGALVAESLRRSGGTYRLETRVVPPVEDAEAGSTPSRARPVPADGWTAVPVPVTPRTRDLAAQVTAGATTPAERVLAVQRHLRAAYAYDLGSAVPPRGQDSVDHFLFVARSGFCEQFAAAAVVMLRSVGVPARLVTGYSGGEADDGARVLRSSDAHAWVEAWVPGTGWVSADPTPAAPTLDLRDRLLATVTSAFTDTSRRRALALVLVLVLVLGVALVTGVRLHGRRGAAPSGQPPPGARSRPSGLAPELLRAYARLTRVLAEAGRGGPPSETIGELSVRVPEAGSGLRVLERAAYGPEPVRAAEALDAAAELDAVSARLRPAPVGSASSRPRASTRG